MMIMSVRDFGDVLSFINGYFVSKHINNLVEYIVATNRCNMAEMMDDGKAFFFFFL